MNESRLYIYNLENEVKDIREDIINDCLKTKNRRTDHNFEIFTKHHNRLYFLFKDRCRKSFKKCTIKNHPTKLYSYFTDKDYVHGETWHNHEKTCTICGVLYLKTIKGYGIELNHNDKNIYFEPKDFDLLIFPGFLYHRPIIHKTKTRVSLQFEVFCNESSEEIFFSKNTMLPQLTNTVKI